ncbi:hypothetical protein BH10BAC1_BH10BAC1_17860 [soil metagenome]
MLDTYKSHKMKKILLSATAIMAFAFNGLAQVAPPPDFSFEAWTAVALPGTSAEDPNGWASFNTLNSSFTSSMPITVSKETTGSIPTGIIACKITTDVIPSTILIPNPFTPGQNFDTVGFVATGKVVIGSPPKLSLGFNVPTGVVRPATLSFSSKYSPMAGDSAFVLAYLTKYNGSSRDTIATGQYATNATTTSFAVNTITMNYNPAFSTVWADSMIVIASSSVFKHSGAKKGSIFWVDDFVWSGWNSINELGNLGSVSLYPNPATNQISFTSSVNAEVVEVLDITGRKVGTFFMTGNVVTIQTATFNAGMYIYNVLNEKKQIINRGKFEVTK